MSEVIPAHIGFILDGNRRWATEQGLATLEGHRQGSENFRIIALEAFRRGVHYVSGYVFSSENWQRTEEEVGYLMSLVSKAVEDYLETFHNEGVKIIVLGRRDGLRSKVLKAITRAEEVTKDNTKGTLALCFNYGGKQEIVDAVTLAAEKGENMNMINKITLDKYIYHPEVPAMDLLIRTSGEQRLSGFMLWRSTYAELYFSDKYWPAFDADDLEHALDWYINRERRLGS